MTDRHPSALRRRLSGVGAILCLLAALSASSALGASSAPARAKVSAAAALDPALFAKLATGVVLVRGFDCSGTGKIEGTGFLVGSGVVMTTRHVVDPSGAEAKFACSVKVRLDGHWVAAAHTSWWYRGSDPTGRGTDLATVKLAQPAKASDYIFGFRNSSAPAGTNLAMIGHPLGTEISLTQGKLIGRIRNHGVPLMAIRMLGAAGSSGSPIVDDGGHVVGVLQLGLGNGETSGISLGIDLPSWWGSGHAFAKTLCKAYPLGGVPGCPGTKPPPPPPPPAYTFSGCWLQPVGDGTAQQEAAITTVAGADVLAAGAANWRLDYQLTVPAPSALAENLTLTEPNGAVFSTEPDTWATGIVYTYTDLNWTFPDGTLFFQNPATTGAGLWTATMTLPNGAACSVPFTVS